MPMFLLSKEFLNSKNCAQCHKKQYENWKKSPHFTASKKLTDKQKKNKKCISCHKPNPNEEGVGCEACHGKGEFYAKRYVMKDKKLSKMLGLKKVNQKTCDRCHNKFTIKGKKDIEKENTCSPKKEK